MSYTPPIPVPAGMTRERLESMGVTEGEWRREESGFRCRQCEGPAYLHPYTNKIWGCKTCRLTTSSVHIYFYLARGRQ